MLNVYFINVLMSLSVLEAMLRKPPEILCERRCTPFEPATGSIKMNDEYNSCYEVVDSKTTISGSYEPLKPDEGMNVSQEAQAERLIHFYLDPDTVRSVETSGRF